MTRMHARTENGRTSAPHSHTALSITGVGMVTSVGVGAVESTAAIRADITRMAELSLVNRSGEPIVGAPVKSVQRLPRSRDAGLRAWAAVAASEAMAQAKLALSGQRLAVLWCGPSSERPGPQPMPAAEREGWIREVMLHRARSVTWVDMPLGNAAGLIALRTARELLARRDVDACLIGGVDSLLSLRTIRWLEDHARLKTETNSDGLIPGEAAAFIVVQRSDSSIPNATPVLARVIGLGAYAEHNSVLCPNPCRGEGLARALRTALAEAGMEGTSVRSVLCDLNGEAYRAREWLLALMRSLPGYSNKMALAHPADCLGDVGGATGPLLIAIAATLLRREMSVSSTALLWASSDGEHRAAAVLEVPEPSAYEPMLGRPKTRVPDAFESAPIDATRVPNDHGTRSPALPVTEFTEQRLVEHIQEAGFLADQRLALLTRGDLPWRSLGRLEHRLLAHVDAVALHGVRALSLAASFLESDDRGEVFAAALSILCTGTQDAITRVTGALTRARPNAREALGQALASAPEPVVRQCVSQLLHTHDVLLRTVAFRVIGRRRFDDHRLGRYPAPGLAAESFYFAIGRLGDRDGSRSCAEAARNRSLDPDVRLAAVLATLRLGDRTALDSLSREGLADWVWVPLALAGDRTVAQTLVEIASARRVSPSALLALGLFGDIGAMPALMEHLGSEELAETAALALELITGAGLVEVVTVADESSDASETHTAEAVTRVARDSEMWRGWWRRNQSRFDPHVRYRRGLPHSPAELLRAMLDEAKPRVVRQFAYEELVTRYVTDIPFESDMLVVEQEAALQRYQLESGRWHRFRPGSWYFAGELLTG